MINGKTNMTNTISQTDVKCDEKADISNSEAELASFKHHQGVTNLNRAGEVFMYCVWVQGVMASLVVLVDNPQYKADFVEFQEQLSHEFVQKRTDLLKRPFKDILTKFKKKFAAVISSDDSTLLDLLSELRDLFAHCHISLGRPYLLWGPKGSFEDRIRAFGLTPDPSQKHQLVLWDGTDETVYLKCFEVIQQLDQGILCRVAESLGIGYRFIR